MFETIKFILEFARQDFLCFIITLMILSLVLGLFGYISQALNGLFSINVTVNKNENNIKEKEKE